VEDIVRRTTTDEVYAQLYDEIASLKILPGTKLSETEVARRFGVSRQPVRDAFTKLDNEQLLIIRPQRATKVRGFSMDRIALARFVRIAVELEVTKCAIDVWNTKCVDALDSNITRQEQALKAGNLPEFHALDYDFHRIICDLSGNPLAFEVVRDSKEKVDRLCVLSLTKDSEAASVLEDHRTIAVGLASGDLNKAQTIIRAHVSRLDKTINFIHETHPNYFE
jgi:DNA-binding GntR family transcriptional regulator